MPFTQPWLEVNFGTAYAGLVGTVGYRLYQSNDADSVARTTTGIVEIGTNTGCYGVVPPSIPDNAVGIEWDTGGGSPVSASEDLEPFRRRAVVEGKLPTNFIMGSSVQTDKDDEIDNILLDTADMQPKLGTPAADISADIAAVKADTAAVLLDTAAMEPLVSLNLDATVSSRAVPGDAMALTAGERTTLAGVVDTTLSASHGAGSWATATGFAVPGDAMTLTAGERTTLAGVVDTTLTASHGAGAWTSASAVDWTSTEKEQIRFRLAMDGTQTDPTTGVGTIEDILADTAAIEPLATTNLDATVSSRAVAGDAMTLTAGERTTLAGVIDTTLSGSHGAGSWATATGFAVPGDAMTLTAGERTTLAGVVDTTLTASHGAGAWTSASAVDWSTAEKEAIREALGVPGTKTGATGGQLQDVLADTAAIEPLTTANLNATVSSRAQPGDAMALTAGERTTLAGVVDTTLTASHGAGSWQTAAASADWTAGEREQIRFRLAMDGTQTDPTTGTGTLEDILADTAETQGKLPTNDIADETLQQAAHTATQAAIAALNNLAAVDILLVKQTYAYDKTNDALEGMIWVESLDGQIVTPTSVSVDVRDVDNALLFNMTDAAPDASGFFKVTRAAPGFTTGLAFKAVASVTVPVVGVLTSGYGMFTIG